MARVSVIIAAYNCEEYIYKCIDSILMQSFSDLEIIICDDASTDSTWEKLNKYSKLENVILLRNNKNMHSAYARNRCIEAATGDYIAIQDADDYSEVDRIEKQVNFLDNNKNYDLVGTGIHQFDNKGIWLTGYKKERPDSEDFLFAIPFAHATLMFRRELLVKVNGYRVARETRRVEDYDMIMRIYAQGYKGYNLHDPLYYYRVDQNTYRRRKYRYRVDESFIRYKRFKELGLLPKGYIYVIKPLLVGLIPKGVLKKIKYNFTSSKM